MITRRLLALGACALLSAAACASDDGDRAREPESERTAEGPSCGDGRICESGQFCIETQGALCMPLPPPGGQCEPGCVLTEHCCNCSAFACLDAPEGTCAGEASCGCLALDQGFLSACGPDRRECDDHQGGAYVLCIRVALDEDPFADAGAN